MKSNTVIWITLVVILASAWYWFMRPNREPVLDNMMEEDAMMQEAAVEGATVNLFEQNDLGQTGTAVLRENESGQLMVELSMTGGSFSAPQPAHIHLGSCQEPGAVEYPLTNVVDGESVTTLDVSWSELVAADTPMAINVHKSAAEASVYTSCGDLPL